MEWGIVDGSEMQDSIQGFEKNTFRHAKPKTCSFKTQIL